MNTSVFAVITNPEPLDFEGRFICESSQDLTNTLLSEYKIRFNNPTEFAKWLLKYHWLVLAGSTFTSYVISTKVALKQNIKRRVPIFMGDKVMIYSLGHEVEFVNPTHLGKYIDTLYLLSIPNSELGIYQYNEEKKCWLVTETVNLDELKKLDGQSDQPQSISPIAAL